MSVEEALEPWLSRPTCFSSHPSDEERLRTTIQLLKKLPESPSPEELEMLILRRVEHMPAMLGTPPDISVAAREFAIKISAKL